MQKYITVLLVAASFATHLSATTINHGFNSLPEAQGWTFVSKR